MKCSTTLGTIIKAENWVGRSYFFKVLEHGLLPELKKSTRAAEIVTLLIQFSFISHFRMYTYII